MKTLTAKTLFASLAAVAAVTAAAAPAAAQPYERPDSGRYYEQDRYAPPHRGPERHYRDFSQRQEAAHRKIERGFRNGVLSRREASHLRDVARGLVNLEVRYSRNGLSRGEYADLNNRYERLEQQIRIDRRDRDHRPG